MHIRNAFIPTSAKRRALHADVHAAVCIGSGQRRHPWCLPHNMPCAHVQPMLLEAEDKFYDTLRLGHKHPDTRVDFVVCDAHCMVAPEEAKSAAAASPATR